MIPDYLDVANGTLKRARAKMRENLYYQQDLHSTSVSLPPSLHRNHNVKRYSVSEMIHLKKSMAEPTISTNVNSPAVVPHKHATVASMLTLTPGLMASKSAPEINAPSTPLNNNHRLTFLSMMKMSSGSPFMQLPDDIKLNIPAEILLDSPESLANKDSPAPPSSLKQSESDGTGSKKKKKKKKGGGADNDTPLPLGENYFKANNIDPSAPVRAFKPAKWGEKRPPSPSTVNPNGDGGIHSTPQSAMSSASKSWTSRDSVITSPSTPEEAAEFEKRTAVKATLSLLNKLTPEKFDVLVSKFISVRITNPQTLRAVIDIIFDKATHEGSFCGMYAHLCERLNGVLPEFTEKGHTHSFRRMLLTKCYENLVAQPAAPDLTDTAAESDPELKKLHLESALKKARQTVLGNVVLIGELFKRDLLTENIMHVCLSQFLENEDDPVQDDIEAACLLLNTVGKALDVASTLSKQSVDKYIEGMKRLATHPLLISRIRFLLADTIELRLNRWEPRIQKIVDPKKLSEVKKEISKTPSLSSSKGKKRIQYTPEAPNSAPVKGRLPDLYIKGSPNRAKLLSSKLSRTLTLGGGEGLGEGGDVDVDLNDSIVEEDHDNATITLPLPGGGSIVVDESKIIDVTFDSASFKRKGGGTSASERKKGFSKGISSTATTTVSTTATATSNKSVTEEGDGGEVELEGVGSVVNTVMATPSKGETVIVLQEQGVVGSDYEVDEEEDMEDDDYDPIREVIESKAAIIWNNYFGSCDGDELKLSIEDFVTEYIDAPPIIIFVGVSRALEKREINRTQLTVLFQMLAEKKVDVFDEKDIAKGFEELIMNMDDLKLDAPNAPKFVKQLLQPFMVESRLHDSDVIKRFFAGA